MNVDRDEMFKEICEIETTLESNYVSEVIGISEILEWASINEKELYEKLIKLYGQYYGECSKDRFW